MHDRQSRSQRQGVDASRVGVHEWVETDIECFGTPLERLDQWREIAARPDFRSDDLETERVGRRHHCIQWLTCGSAALNRIANWRRAGTISRKSSTRLPTV